MTYSPEKFLSLLPVRPLHEPTIGHNCRTVRDWPWDLPIVYLGYSRQQRVRLWQLQWWLIHNGVMDKWTNCDMCGSPKNLIGFHADDYYDVTRTIATCRGCHYSLHRREETPGAWTRVKAIARSRSNNYDAWWDHIPPVGYDLAAYQRERFPGRDLDDYFNSPLFDMPAGTPQPLGFLGLDGPRERKTPTRHRARAKPIQPTLF